MSGSAIDVGDGVWAPDRKPVSPRVRPELCVFYKVLLSACHDDLFRDKATFFKITKPRQHNFWCFSSSWFRLLLPFTRNPGGNMVS